MDNTLPIHCTASNTSEPTAKVLFWHVLGTPENERLTAEYRLAANPWGGVGMQRLYFVRHPATKNWNEHWRAVPTVLLESQR